MVKAARAEQPVSDMIKRHVERYRITTVDVVHRLFYPDKTREAAKKSLNRMVDARDLVAVPIGKRTFYQRRGTPPVASQSLWERFAVLSFCVMHEPRCERLTPAEFSARFPEFATARGISASHQHYFLPLTGLPRLGRAIVDSDAEPDRAARKCRDTFREASAVPGLLPLIDARLFVIAALFAEKTKADAVAARLQEANISEPFQFHVIPELNEIVDLLSPHHGTDHKQEPA